MSAQGRATEAPVLKTRSLAAERAIAASTGYPLAVVQGVLSAARTMRTKKARRPGDFYETPGWAVKALLGKLTLPDNALILDAGAGTGAITAEVSAAFPKADIIGIEKDGGLVHQARMRGVYNATLREENFLSLEFDLTPDLVISNPPYSNARPFVDKALKLVKRSGTVAFLLRLSWMSGKCRKDLFTKHPCDVFALDRRPSFTGGGTDATDYGWFVWGPGRGGRWERLVT